MNAFTGSYEYSQATKGQKEYGKRAENGFSACPLFFHTAYTSKYLHLFLSVCLYYASPLKIGSRLPCPQKAEIFLTQRPTSIGTCYEIRWFGWFLHSMFILSIPIWDALKGFLSTQNVHTWGPDCKPTLVAVGDAVREGMPFVYWKWFVFFKIAVLCLVFCLPFTVFVCVFFPGQFWWLTGLEIQANRSCTLFRPWSTMIHQAKDGSHWKNVPPWTRDTKKGTPCNRFFWGTSLCVRSEKCWFPWPQMFQPKPHSPQKDL